MTTAGLVLAGAKGESAAEGMVAISRFRLANGLDVVVIPDHRTPVVTHMIWYRAGAADEPRGKTGIAHFLEHLMFKGTKSHPEGEFSRLVAELGGEENAFTSNDYTAYFQRVAKQHLRKMMEFEADRMRGLVLSDAVVDPEREVVLEERRMRTDSVPASQLGEAMSAAAFVNHPYGAPIIGWKPEIESLNRADALAFYQRFYAPNNAILIIAGDVEAEEVRALAEKTYGKNKPTRDLPARVRPKEPDPVAARKVVLSDQRVEQPVLQRMYLTPSYTTAKPGEAEALDILAQAMGAQSTGRLNQRLVLERKLAVSASAWYSGTALDDHLFGIYAVPAQGVTLEDLEDALDEALAEMAETGFSDAELARAKTRLMADAIYQRDSQSALARNFGAALSTGLTAEQVIEWPGLIERVPRSAVKEALHWLVKKRSVTGYLEGIAR
ncbi:MAG: insulinase family protein [Hyphomicrobiales bacterium]|nr:insulinase family protein [Hyphomicrobiales bacterium]